MTLQAQVSKTNLNFNISKERNVLGKGQVELPQHFDSGIFDTFSKVGQSLIKINSCDPRVQ